MTPSRRAKIERRRAARRCLQCDAGLMDEDFDAGREYCTECTDIRAEARSRHEKKNPKRANRRGTKPHQEDPAQRRQKRDNAKAAQRCTQRSCGKPAADDSEFCEKHRETRRRDSREYQRRKTGYYDRHTENKGTP